MPRNEEYPMPVFDEETVIQDDTDLLIRLALLAESGLTLEEVRAYESQFGRKPD